MERRTAEDLSHRNEMGSKKRMSEGVNLQTIKRNRSESEVDGSISQSIHPGNFPMNLTKKTSYNTDMNRASDSITINMDLGRDTRRDNIAPEKLITVSEERVSSKIAQQSFPNEDVPHNFIKMDGGNVCDTERKDVPFNFQVNRKQELDITGNLADRHEWMDRDVYYKTRQVEESGEVKKRGMNNLKTFTPRVIKTEEKSAYCRE